MLHDQPGCGTESRTGSVGTARLLCLVILLLLALPLAAAGSGARISSEFTLSSRELGTMIHSLPKDIQERILAKPDGFLQLVARVLDERPDFFLLVDKTHRPCRPTTYLPTSSSPSDYSLSVSRRTIELRKAIMPAAVQMSDAARADGVTLLVLLGVPLLREPAGRLPAGGRHVRREAGGQGIGAPRAFPASARHGDRFRLHHRRVRRNTGAGNGLPRTPRSTVSPFPIPTATRKSRATGTKAGTTATSRARVPGCRRSSSTTSSSTCWSSSTPIAQRSRRSAARISRG